MTRKMLRTFSVLLLIFTVGSLDASAQHRHLTLFYDSTDQWKKYTSTEGKFSVLLPGVPETGYRQIGKDSPASITRVVNLQNTDSAYIIAYFDLPARITDSVEVEKLFDETRDRIVQMYSLKIEDEEKTIHLTYPARSLKMKDQDGEKFLTRVVLVKQRVYHLSLVPYSDKYKAENIAKFFDSFKPVPLTDDEISNLHSFSKEENAKATPHKIRVSESTLRNRAINKEMPKYSIAGDGGGISGSVKVEILISEQGEVIGAKAISGPEQLRASAVMAAQKWTFKPIVMDSDPLRVEGELTFEFKSK